MKEPTLERSHFPVPCATRVLLTLLVWRCMKGSIQERSHLHVPSVIKHFNKIVIWRSMRGHTQERSHLPAPSGFLTRPMKEHMVRKPIIANNVTRNLANLFPRKSKKPYYCKQCGKNFSYLLFLEKRYANFFVTLFAMMGFLFKVFCQVHESTHTGEKSFACSKNDKTLKKGSFEWVWKDPHRRETICQLDNFDLKSTKIEII